MNCQLVFSMTSAGFQPLLRPVSTTSLSPLAMSSSSCSPSPSLTLSRPTSVLGDKEVLYAQLDLTPSATPFLPPCSDAHATPTTTTSSSPRNNAAVSDVSEVSSSSTSTWSSSTCSSSMTTYAQIDFQKSSEALKSVPSSGTR